MANRPSEPQGDADLIWECIYDHGNGKYKGEKSAAQRAEAFAALERLKAQSAEGPSMTDKTPAMHELPEPELGYIETDKSRQPAFSARQMREALQSAQPAVPMTDEQMHDAYKQAPDSKNCMQCAAAYMLGLPMAAVPDFEKAGADAWESFEAFFADRGFTAEMFPPSVEIVGDYLASGDTARGTSHMVVMRCGELLHDPHPSNAGLKSIQAVWLITRRAGCRDGITQRADGGEKQA